MILSAIGTIAGLFLCVVLVYCVGHLVMWMVSTRYASIWFICSMATALTCHGLVLILWLLYQLHTMGL